MGILYVVAGPIGNLGDLSQRAGEILASARLVVAEDTRTTQRLLEHLGLAKPLLSYNEHNHRQRVPQVLATLGAGDVALLSEAGTPAISDPGARLVDEAWQAGYQVTPIPGPSAIVAALSASGFPATLFEFIGFWPRTAGRAAKLLDRLADTEATTVAFEAPTRIAKTLPALAARLPERRLLIAREMTKLHEELLRGTCSELAERLVGRSWRGEITMVIEGGAGSPSTEVSEDIQADEGRPGAIARRISRQTGLSRRDVYRVLLALGKDVNI